MKTEQARQGDIFFEKVAANDVPNTGKKLNTPILAYGEVTGHSHKIISPAFSTLDSSVATNGDIFVHSATSDITVDHDEHGKVTLESGCWWNVSRQREYDPLAVSRERRVAD